MAAVAPPPSPGELEAMGGEVEAMAKAVSSRVAADIKEPLRRQEELLSRLAAHLGLWAQSGFAPEGAALPTPLAPGDRSASLPEQSPGAALPSEALPALPLSWNFVPKPLWTPPAQNGAGADSRALAKLEDSLNEVSNATGSAKGDGGHHTAPVQLADIRNSHTTLFKQAICTIEAHDKTGLVPLDWALHHLVCFYNWSSQLREPKRSGLMSTVVESMIFKSVSIVAILLNGIFASVKADFDMAHAGDSAASDGAAARLVVQYGETFFLTFFSVELAMHLWVSRLYFFCNDKACWNVFDFSLIFLAVVDLSVAQHTNQGALNMTFMRVIRVLKLTKIFRLFRAIRFFKELRLMLSSIIGSLVSLFWAILMLSFMLYVLSLCFLQGVINHLYDEDRVESADREKLLAAFGCTTQTMLTLYKAVTGGADWEVYYDILNRVEPPGFYGPLFLLYIAFFTFAVANILTGIIIDNVSSLSHSDSTRCLSEFREHKKDFEDAVGQIYARMDHDGDGRITWEDFERHAGDEGMQAYFASMQLNLDDARLFFKTLVETGVASDGTLPTVDVQKFVRSCEKMRGPASGLDMQSLLFQAKLMEERTRCQEELQRAQAWQITVLHQLVAGLYPKVSAPGGLVPGGGGGPSRPPLPPQDVVQLPVSNACPPQGSGRKNGLEL